MGRPDGKYLGEIERGYHSPTITTAKSISDALGTTLAELVEGLNGSETPSKKPSQG